MHHLHYPVGRTLRPLEVIGLCSAHHARAHQGTLLIARQDDGELSFRHADGTDYGAKPAVSILVIREQLQGALVHMGFRSARVREVVARLCSEVGPRPSIQELLRKALALLTN